MQKKYSDAINAIWCCLQHILTVLSKKRITCVVLAMTVSIGVFAQETDLDTAFAEIDRIMKEYEQVDTDRQTIFSAMLDSYVELPQYASIERYVLKKARYYIIYNNFSCARDIAYVLVDHNLDNLDAASLYTAASKAISQNELAVKLAAEKKAAEEAHMREEAEKIKGNLGDEYKVVVNPETGKSIYFDQQANMYYSRYIWSFGMRFMDLSMGMGDELSMQYGVGADGSFYYYGDSLRIGAEFYGGMAIVSLAGSGSMTSTAKFAGCIGLPVGKSAVCARVGGYMHNSDMQTGDNSFISPLVGVSWRDIHIGSAARFSVFFDYFPWSIVRDDYTFAGDTGAFLSFPLFKADSVVMNFTVGFQDTITAYDGDVKNLTEIVFALGVGNNE